LLTRCEDYNDPGNGNNNEGNGSGNVLVSDKAFFEQEFIFGSVVTGADGYFKYNSGRAGLGYPYFVTDQDTRGISGAQLYIYENALNKSGLISIIDSSGNYMPRNFSTPFSGMKGTQGVFLRLDKVKDAIKNGFSRVQNYLDDALPSWNWEKIDDNPGAIYTGDWSINEIKNWTDFLEKSSLTLTKVFPGAGVVYSVFATAGKVAEVIDKAIDSINNLNLGEEFKIDKDQQHSLFLPGGLISPSFIMANPLENALDYKIEDIKHFFPTEPGMKWKMLKNCSGIPYNAEISGTKNFNGNSVCVLEDSSLKSYYGFAGNKLIFCGFNHSSTGDVIFDPPISVGDHQIQKGKKYSGTSKVKIEKLPNLEASLFEEFDYQDREVIEDCVGKFYGGCFKVKETCRLIAGEEVSEMGGTHWFAKNVGKVKAVNDSGEFRLLEVSGPNIKSSENSSNNFDVFFEHNFGLVTLILDRVKKENM
jgi:hypothetical protein